MNNEIAHMRIVNAALSGIPPGTEGLRIIRIDADDVERLQVFEFDLIELRQFAAENEMKQLFLLHLPAILNQFRLALPTAFCGSGAT